MKTRLAVFGFALSLCGCSDGDMNRLLSYGPDSTPSSTASADTPAPMASSQPVQTAEIAPPSTQADVVPPVQAATGVPPPSLQTYSPQPTYTVTRTVTTVTLDPTMSYCHTVAQSSGAVATRDGMDDTDQQNAADSIYRECMRMYGRPGN